MEEDMNEPGTGTSPGSGGERVHGVDFSGAHLHGPAFESTRITDGWFLNADISGYIGGLRVNGVEIAPLVEAELDRRFPDRVMLRASDPAGLTAAWSLIEAIWRDAVERARRLPEAQWYERVDGEWSFVETLRHLIMATDRWLLAMVRGEAAPFHPWGIAPSDVHGEASDTVPLTSPSLDEVLEVRRGRMGEVRKTIEACTPEELARTCGPPVDGSGRSDEYTVLDCLHVILDEEWEHNHYATRDLDILASRL